jgi:hypothetical protein
MCHLLLPIAPQALQQTLQARRLAAAQSGNIAILTTLGLGELQAFPASDAAALQQLATRLQHQGPLVQQQVVTGRVQLAQLTQEQQQQLAWQLHKGAPEQALAVMDVVLAQAAAASRQEAQRVAGAAADVQAVGLGLQLERATSAVSTAAAPSPVLLAGEPRLCCNPQLGRPAPVLSHWLTGQFARHCCCSFDAHLCQSIDQ